jgi:hypothetical protein
MMLAVHLDDQLALVNGEVRDEVAYRRLPTDMDPEVPAEIA